MFVVAKDGVSTAKVQRDLERLLRERRRIKPGEEDDFAVMDTKQMASTMTSVTNTLTGLLSAVAAVSLLVGGIGIMNIMLVSVTERTREIGLRMAVGARGRDILRQFLVEAVTLSLIGGLVGILLGVGASYLVGHLAQWRIELSLTAIALAVGFAAAVGVFFGFYPARKAASLSPIEALRYE
jgi:putative ABC transport system permease protein